MNTTNIDLAPLQAHLNAITARIQAWVAEDPANRWACGPVDDASVWAGWGITTVAAYEHYSLVSQAFEMTRDVWGYKPSWAHLDALTDDALKAEIAALSEAGERIRAMEEAETVAEATAAAEAMNHRSGFTLAEIGVL